VTPYNTAVTGTNYSAPLRIIMEDPDDYSVLEQVPVIIMDYPYAARQPFSTGVGDPEMWVYPQFGFKVYPGMITDATTGAEKPSPLSTNILRSLFEQISTGLVVPLYDYSTNPATEVDFAYIDMARTSDTKGAMRDMLAMEKFRFNFDLRLRFMVEASVQ
jgi:hypothetical protein